MQSLATYTQAGWLISEGSVGHGSVWGWCVGGYPFLMSQVVKPASCGVPGSTNQSDTGGQSGGQSEVVSVGSVPRVLDVALLPVRMLVDPGLLVPGAELSFVVDGFEVGEDVSVLVASEPQVIGTGIAGASGEVVFVVRVPVDVPVGVHHLVVWAEGSGVGFRQPFTVTADVAKAPDESVNAGTNAGTILGESSGVLPVTGGESPNLWLVLLAALMAVLGRKMKRIAGKAG
jgi:hypothetical protein